MCIASHRAVHPSTSRGALPVRCRRGDSGLADALCKPRATRESIAVAGILSPTAWPWRPVSGAWRATVDDHLCAHVCLCVPTTDLSTFCYHTSCHPRRSAIRNSSLYSIIVDRLHPLYDHHHDLDPFTAEQCQDAADSDVPQQLLHWRLPRQQAKANGVITGTAAASTR